MVNSKAEFELPKFSTPEHDTNATTNINIGSKASFIDIGSISQSKASFDPNLLNGKKSTKPFRTYQKKNKAQFVNEILDSDMDASSRIND
jgi:hypothetical protein